MRYGFMRSVALVLVITFALTLFSCNHASDTPGFESGEYETAPTENQVYLLYSTLDYLENYKYTYYMTNTETRSEPPKKIRTESYWQHGYPNTTKIII